MRKITGKREEGRKRDRERINEQVGQSVSHK